MGVIKGGKCHIARSSAALRTISYSQSSKQTINVLHMDDWQLFIWESVSVCVLGTQLWGPGVSWKSVCVELYAEYKQCRVKSGPTHSHTLWWKNIYSFIHYYYPLKFLVGAARRGWTHVAPGGAVSPFEASLCVDLRACVSIIYTENRYMMLKTTTGLQATLHLMSSAMLFCLSEEYPYISIWRRDRAACFLGLIIISNQSHWYLSWWIQLWIALLDV